MSTAVAKATEPVEASKTFPQETIVQVVSTGKSNVPYLVGCIASNWSILSTQQIIITFSLESEVANTQFPSNPDQAVIWVTGAPTLYEVQITSNGQVLILSQTNVNSGPGDQVFDFRLGVEIDGELHYSYDPTIINSPVGG